METLEAINGVLQLNEKKIALAIGRPFKRSVDYYFELKEDTVGFKAEAAVQEFSAPALIDEWRFSGAERFRPTKEPFPFVSHDKPIDRFFGIVDVNRGMALLSDNWDLFNPDDLESELAVHLDNAKVVAAALDEVSILLRDDCSLLDDLRKKLSDAMMKLEVPSLAHGAEEESAAQPQANPPNELMLEEDDEMPPLVDDPQFSNNRPSSMHNSLLLQQHESPTLLDWFPGEWTAIYRGTRDGLTPDDFHYSCDYKGPTITVIRDVEGYVYGGYTSRHWDSSGGWQFDSSAAIFSLIGPNESAPMRLPIRRGHRAIYSSSESLPHFGDTDDIMMYHDQQGVHSRVGGSAFASKGVTSKSFLKEVSGKVADIEVFAMIKAFP